MEKRRNKLDKSDKKRKVPVAKKSSFANVFVTGAAGFVGKHLCSELLSENISVSATDLNISAISMPVNKVDIGKITPKTNWKDVFDKNNFDTVVHLAARVHVMKEDCENPLDLYDEINTKSTVNLAQQAAMAGVKKFIFMSTIKVNGEKNIDNKPFRHDDIPNPTDPYSVSKLKAEKQIIEICKKTQMEYIIIRPPLIYGNGVKGNFLSLVNLLKTNLPLPLGGISKNKRSFVYVKNLCNMIAKAILNENIKNEIFLIDDGQPLSTKQLVSTMVKSLNSNTINIYFPEKLLKIICKILGKQAQMDRLCENLEIDSSYLQEKLGWKPLFTTQEGIKETLSWFK